jgi:hypothetical protein
MNTTWKMILPSGFFPEFAWHRYMCGIHNRVTFLYTFYICLCMKISGILFESQIWWTKQRYSKHAKCCFFKCRSSRYGKIGRSPYLNFPQESPALQLSMALLPISQLETLVGLDTNWMNSPKEEEGLASCCDGDPWEINPDLSGGDEV